MTFTGSKIHALKAEHFWKQHITDRSLSLRHYIILINISSNNGLDDILIHILRGKQKDFPEVIILDIILEMPSYLKFIDF